MYTSVTCLALACSLSVVGTENPVWHQNYGKALEAGLKMNRPVAVFVARKAQPGQATQDGLLSPDVRKVLANQYVCVLVDGDLPQNRNLMTALAITKDAGIVLGDRTGSLQMFHHDGKISQEQLASTLWRFADPNLVVQTTVSNVATPVSQTSYYPATVVPTTYQTPFNRVVPTVNC